MNLWDNADSGDKVGVEGLVRELTALPKNVSDASAYSVVVVNMGSHNYSDVARAGRLLQAAGGIDVVLPEVLLQRLVARTAQQVTCPLPRGAWDEQCGDLPKCSIAAGGSCEFSCNNILRPLPIPVSCNLNTCANLKLAPTKLHFICEDDGSVCTKR